MAHIIVINALSARQGGGITYIQNLIAHVPLGIFHILLIVPDGFTLDSKPESVDIMYIGVLGKNPVLRALWERFCVPRLMKRINADIIFSPGGVCNTKVPKSIKSVTMFRNMIPFDPVVLATIPFGLSKLRNMILKRQMLKTMRESDLTIFISKFAKDIINREVTIKNQVIIPHGINSIFREYRDNLIEGLRNESYFLYVSKFDVYKHHDVVIKAYSLLPAEIQKIYRLVFVGEINSSEYEINKSLVESLGLGERVLFLGAVPYRDLPSLYQNAYVNIFASSCENCPNIMLEALASGRPLLCSDIPPMPEFGKQAVLYFSPYDPTSLLELFSMIVGNDEAIEYYSMEVKKLSQNYSWEVTASRTWKSIQSLVDS